MKKKVLLTRPLHIMKQTEEKMAQELDIVLSPRATEKDILPLVRDVNGIIAHGTTITQKVIQSAPLLQVIATPQVGFEKIDVTAATKAGVAVIANTGLAPVICIRKRIGQSEQSTSIQHETWELISVAPRLE